MWTMSMKSFFPCNSSFYLLVKSSAMFIFLNGTSGFLILFKFGNISHFLLSSFSNISICYFSQSDCILYHALVKSNLDYAFAKSYKLLDILFFPIFKFRFL